MATNSMNFSSQQVVNLVRRRVVNITRRLHCSNKQWQTETGALEVAATHKLNTNWYSLYKHPKSLQERYHYDYWLNFYIYTDLRKLGEQNNEAAFQQKLEKAFSGNWSVLL